MKTEVKKLDSTKREISIEVAGELVENKFAEVFKKIGETAKVKGFRVGHVPKDVLEKEFSSLGTEMVLKDLIPEIYNQAMEREGIRALDLPNIFDVKLDRTTLAFKARVEVSSEIKLKNYLGLKVNYKKIEIEAKEVKRNIDALKEKRKVETLDDKFAKSLGYSTLAELEKAQEMQIFVQKDNLQRQKIENEILQNLTRDLEFKLPESLVKRQLDDLVKNAKLDLLLKGLPREKINEQEKRLPEELRPEAEGQVKVYLVLAEIAKRENIPLDNNMPQRVMEYLLSEAYWIESSE